MAISNGHDQLAVSASSMGRVSDLRLAIQNGADINIGSGLLMRNAIRAGHANIVKALAEMGARLDYHDYQCPRMAVRYGYSGVIQAMLDLNDESVREVIHQSICSEIAPEESRSAVMSWEMMRTIKAALSNQKSDTFTDNISIGGRCSPA